MRSVLTAVLSLLFCLVGSSSLCVAAAASSKPLQIYFIDVEGGQATLVVTPLGESLLIDTGWPGYEGRDADRIVAAAHQAGIKQLDYVLITHFHRDHVGGVPQLVDGIKVGTFVDHGPNQEDSEVTRTDYAAYEKAIAGHAHVVVKPGWGLPDQRSRSARAGRSRRSHLRARCLEQEKRIPTAVPNRPPQRTALRMPVPWGVLITYGQFRFLDLGDLTKKKELEIACPNNLIGTVDLFLVTHHGADLSNPKALVWALASARGRDRQRSSQGIESSGMADRPRFSGAGRLVAAALRGRIGQRPQCGRGADREREGKLRREVSQGGSTKRRHLHSNEPPNRRAEDIREEVRLL